jgi:hypothetical protein
MTADLPDYDPHLLEQQIALVREMHRRGWYSDEELQRQIERLQAEDREKRARFIAAGYRKFNIPKLEREFHETMARKEHLKLSRTHHWLYAWNAEPEENPFDLVSCWWKDDTEKERAKHRKRAQPVIARLHDATSQPLEWLWTERMPLGKISLLTGDAGEGKSLIAGDLIARVTTGRDWPDGAAGHDPGEVLLITPGAGLLDVIRPRLEAAGADLLRLHPLSAVTWNDPQTGETEGEPFRLPVDGPLLEKFLARRENLRLMVIDPLSACLNLPAAAALRESALHDVLTDLADLADTHKLAILCVESARSGGLIATPSRRNWRAHYDVVFQSVWGVARDPRDRGRRLLLPIRHHLGDDRSGLQFSIQPGDLGAARIEWGRPEDEITYAEATGRVRLGRSIWSFSQTADAETWLRVYLADGEKPSLQIFSDARDQGFTEHPVRDALRRVASKFKQGHGGPWSWRLNKLPGISLR